MTYAANSRDAARKNAHDRTPDIIKNFITLINRAVELGYTQIEVPAQDVFPGVHKFFENHGYRVVTPKHDIDGIVKGYAFISWKDIEEYLS